VRHLRRLNICINNISDDNLQSEYIKYKITNKIKESKIDPKKSNLNPKKSNLNPKKSKKEYICDFCENIYSTNSNLYKHHKICKDKIKDDEVKDSMTELVEILNNELKKRDKQIDEQNKQIDEQNKQINELIKKTGINIGTQNIQNNIKILAYKNTDISHLTDKDYLYCLNRSNMCIPNLIKKIHFNPKKTRKSQYLYIEYKK
jgi:hypothetical protein